MKKIEELQNKLEQVNNKLHEFGTKGELDRYGVKSVIKTVDNTLEYALSNHDICDEIGSDSLRYFYTDSLMIKKALKLISKRHSLTEKITKMNASTQERNQHSAEHQKRQGGLEMTTELIDNIATESVGDTLLKSVSMLDKYTLSNPQLSKDLGTDEVGELSRHMRVLRQLVICINSRGKLLNNDCSKIQ